MHADKRLNSLLTVIQHFFFVLNYSKVFICSLKFTMLWRSTAVYSVMINMIYYFYYNCYLFNSGEDDANLWESGSAVRSKCYT